MPNVTPIAALSDNYIWWLHHPSTQKNLVVDPSTAPEVIATLTQAGQHLDAILITHHHWDHTSGISELLEHYGPIPVYGPGASVAEVSHPLCAGTHAIAGFGDITVLAIPGHTLDHLAYYQAPYVFCGDTLFSGGCGRLFEGTPAQMYHSLAQLMALPDETYVCCAHEYTLSNLTFALTVEPQNHALQNYQAWCQQQRQRQLPTLPSTLAKEKAINPFLRCDSVDVVSSLQQRDPKLSQDIVERFALLRQWKDNF
ncbi:hydroxyacylglutathione hydrolase [Shewanella sp. NIFS-20-20]|uniref:hydroxyacylglutathione hydrolase n=1 Tax=Shewanella sp. NIFS-20-20 TaxID=2853806 RepID=UPI001C4720DB|nr:hydroxyacylglutathione hydrolase [Shewanella sp. NIFS-20-20]MBV7315064.1 hydroxyacylglutathione hydrolase [Shewanella sp. NIFS-20-20]